MTRTPPAAKKEPGAEQIVIRLILKGCSSWTTIFPSDITRILSLKPIISGTKTTKANILVYALITVIILEYILKNSETIFFVIQVFGSIFLMFLGFIFLLRKNNNEEYDDKKISSNSFIQGFTIALINPKILVWFAAIYSQFIFINSSILEKTILVLTPTFVDALWYSLVSIMVTGYGLKEFLNKRKSILEKIIGVFLIIISLSIIYSLFAMR